MDSVTQITADWSSSSTAVKAGMVIAGCLVLYVAFKVGHILLKMLFGVAGLALLGVAICWLFFKH